MVKTGPPSLAAMGSGGLPQLWLSALAACWTPSTFP